MTNGHGLDPDGQVAIETEAAASLLGLVPPRCWCCEKCVERDQLQQQQQGHGDVSSGAADSKMPVVGSGARAPISNGRVKRGSVGSYSSKRVRQWLDNNVHSDVTTLARRTSTVSWQMDDDVSDGDDDEETANRVGVLC